MNHPQFKRLLHKTLPVVWARHLEAERSSHAPSSMLDNRTYASRYTTNVTPASLGDPWIFKRGGKTQCTAHLHPPPRLPNRAVAPTARAMQSQLAGEASEPLGTVGATAARIGKRGGADECGVTGKGRIG
jgi:hypothetical protein